MSDAERLATPGSAAGDPPLIAALRAILAARGPSVLNNRRMMLGLLRDHAPDQARAIRILMAAFDAESPARLHGRAPIDAAAVESEARSLTNDSGLREDLARWAVNLWATALSPAPVVAPAPPAPVLEPAAPPSPATSAAADALIWSTPVAPAVPPPPQPPAPAQDMTWSTPVAPPPPAPPPPPAAVASAPPPAAAVAPAKTSKRGRIAIAASVLIVGLLTLISSLNRLGLFSDTPASEPTAQQEPAPNVLTHGGGAATVLGKMANGDPIVLGSVSQDLNDWPIVPGAGHPNNDLNAWLFNAAIRFNDGRTFYYQTQVQMAPGLNSGQAFLSGVNLANANGDNKVSTSKVAPAVRTKDASGVYRLDMRFDNWQTDGAQSPKICWVFTLEASPARFEPQLFCAVALINGVCTPTYIGCGYFH